MCHGERGERGERSVAAGEMAQATVVKHEQLVICPSGELTQLWKITILVGTCTINGHCQ